jgi:phosphoglycolate phosphatase
MYRGVRETVAVIHATGRVLGVISNKDVALCREILARFGIDGNFAEIMGADSFPFRKPSPEPLLKLMRDFAVSAGETMMVGDSINDVAAGKGAGVLTVGCTYGYGDTAELVGADYYVADFPGLLGLPVLHN